MIVFMKSILEGQNKMIFFSKVHSGYLLKYLHDVIMINIDFFVF